MIEERFWAKVDRTVECWLWTGAQVISKSGRYGKLKTDGKMKYAHRVSYEMSVGEIPAGMQIDHLCHNTLCVNPFHLRAVTQKQNMENRKGAQSNSSSGIRSVSWSRHTGKWKVQLTHHRKTFYFGLFDNLEEAAAVAKAARLQLFTHNDLDRETT